jgi:hypothetical protein
MRPGDDSLHLGETAPSWCQKRTGIPRTMPTGDLRLPRQCRSAGIRALDYKKFLCRNWW